MRYIFTAAIGTLLFIGALLALPPFGESETTLVAQSAGDRLATAGEVTDAPTTTSTVLAARQAVTPEPDPATSPDAEEIEVEVLSEVELSEEVESFLGELNSTRDTLSLIHI